MHWLHLSEGQLYPVVICIYIPDRSIPQVGGKVKGNRHYMLVECLLAYGAVAGNIVYIFNIRIPLAIPGLAFVTLLGGIFTGCLVGALAEVLNVFPIISRRFSIRRYIPYIIYMVAAGNSWVLFLV